MTIITDPVFYIIAVPAILLYGMGKGGLGPGLGAAVVPAMALAINPVQAAAIMLPILCVMDIFALISFKNKFDSYHLKILIPPGIIGIIIASVFIGHLSEDAIRIAIGAIVLFFCLNYWFRSDNYDLKKPGRLSGYIWGIITGFTSMQIHAGGPPLSIYLLPQKLDKVILMGTMAVFFAVMNYLKLIPYAILGQFDSANMMTSLVLMPLAPVGVKLGYFLLNRVKQEIIYRILYILLFVSALKLLYDGVF